MIKIPITCPYSSVLGDNILPAQTQQMKIRRQTINITIPSRDKNIGIGIPLRASGVGRDSCTCSPPFESSTGSTTVFSN